MTTARTSIRRALLGPTIGPAAQAHDIWLTAGNAGDGAEDLRGTLAPT